MSRHIIMGLVLLTGAFGACRAQAQQQCNAACDPNYGCSHEDFCYDFYRNNRWPLPFRGTDTAAVLSYFDVQRSIGWKLHNTLGHAMFEPGTQQLTMAGRAHVNWIITQAPQNRRVVFVLVGDNQQLTAARVEATQLAISEMVPVGPLPSIYLTDRDAPGSSGAYQLAVTRAFNSSTGMPRLTGAGPSTGGVGQ